MPWVVDVADRGVPGLVDATDLAARHDLTVVHAAYLALAIDVDGELATGDRALARAALRKRVCPSTTRSLLAAEASPGVAASTGR